MSITITDPALLARWSGMWGMVELKDPDRATAGRVQTSWSEPVPPTVRFHFIDQVADPALLAEFARVNEPVEVFDPDGKRIGRFERTWPGKLPFGFKSPVSDGEFEVARRRERGGRTRAEF